MTPEVFIWRCSHCEETNRTPLPEAPLKQLRCGKCGEIEFEAHRTPETHRPKPKSRSTSSAQ
jgi:hypothetical protein